MFDAVCLLEVVDCGVLRATCGVLYMKILWKYKVSHIKSPEFSALNTADFLEALEAAHWNFALCLFTVFALQIYYDFFLKKSLEEAEGGRAESADADEYGV
jgi:hypothetical protein